MRTSAVVVCALWQFSASAVLIEIDGEQWDVQLDYLGVLHGEEPILKAQPWWGDTELAYRFADAVRGNLGTTSSATINYDGCGGSLCRGPIFAHTALDRDGLPVDPATQIAIPDPSGGYVGSGYRLQAWDLLGWTSTHLRAFDPSGHRILGDFVGIETYQLPTWANAGFAVATQVSVPEPGTLLLLSSALASLAFARRRLRS